MYTLHETKINIKFVIIKIEEWRKIKMPLDVKISNIICCYNLQYNSIHLPNSVPYIDLSS